VREGGGYSQGIKREEAASEEAKKQQKNQSKGDIQGELGCRNKKGKSGRLTPLPRGGLRSTVSVGGPKRSKIFQRRKENTKKKRCLLEKE